jgi:thiol:disulfide interchange protein DsbA
MNRRNFVIAAALCNVVSPQAWAQVAGKDYSLLSSPQPSGVGGKVEVIEFFSFACPHCMELEPHLAKWRAAQPKDVAFRRVPVSFGRPDWATMARMYLTLNALGLSDKLDAKVFDAIHKERVNLGDEKTRDAWLTKQGVDLRKYGDTLRSFAVESMMRRSEQLSQSYKVTSVPSLYVDGRYAVEGTSLEGLLKTTGLLIAKVRTEKAGK